MGELGPSFSTRRLDFFLLFLLLLLLTRAWIFFVLLAIGFPLLLTFTSAPFLLLGLFLRPIGHTIPDGYGHGCQFMPMGIDVGGYRKFLWVQIWAEEGCTR